MRALAALVLAWTFAARAASFADPTEWKEDALLDQRLLVSLPAGARIAAPNHNVMEAPQPPQKQARVMIDAGNLRLVAFVDELFRVAGKSFLELGRKRVAFLKERYDFDALIAADSLLKLAGLEILEFAPRGRAAVPGAYMIRGALVRQPDGTVQQIGFFLNEPGMQDLPAANRLVTRIVGSLRPGPRRLPAAEPVNGYTTYLQPGPDFSVKWFEHLVELNARGGRMGIYSGGHPQSPEAPPGARAVRGKLFGTSAEWRLWQDDGMFHQEAFLTAADRKLHVFMRAVSEEERAEFQRIAESATPQ